MAKPKYVNIAKDEHTGRCTEESLPAWEAHGWTVVEDGSSEPVQQQAEETAKPEVKPQQRRTETKE